MDWIKIFSLFEISRINSSRAVSDGKQEAPAVVIGVNETGVRSMNELCWLIKNRREEAKNILCEKVVDLDLQCVIHVYLVNFIKSNIKSKSYENHVEFCAYSACSAHCYDWAYKNYYCVDDIVCNKTQAWLLEL